METLKIFSEIVDKKFKIIWQKFSLGDQKIALINLFDLWKICHQGTLPFSNRYLYKKQ